MELTNLEFLKEYTEALGPSCFEKPAQKVMENHIVNNLCMVGDKNELIIDSIGNLVLDINKKKSKPSKTIGFFTHVDEVSFHVTSITNGGVYVARRSGDVISAISSKVAILNRDLKPIEGLLNYASHSIRNEIDDDYIFVEILDKNNSAKDIRGKLKIHEGSPLVYTTNTNIYPNNRIIGKALDNRVGGYLVTEILRTLRESYKSFHDNRYIFANVVQEEIGGNGAAYLAKNYKGLETLDIAFVIDSTHDFSSFGTTLDNKRQNNSVSIDNGPVITLSPLSNYDIFTKSLSVLESENIKYQVRSKTKSSLTDLDRIYVNNFKGFLIQFPTRYMHSSYEMVSQSDIISLCNAVLNIIEYGNY